MQKLAWENFPLPLIQVNPPAREKYNQIIEYAYKSGIFSNSAYLHTQCSMKLAKHVNEDFEGYLTSSNTSGLVACLLALRVRDRHVILSNFTFAATLQAIVLAGGKPVLCDINPVTLEIDPKQLANILDSNEFDVAAVVPTRVFGFNNDHSPIIEICAKREIPVVTDAAASFPAFNGSWNFTYVSTFEVFSLHATKVFGIGEGGLVVGNAKNVELMKERANFGLDHAGTLNYVDGLNAKADEFTAARALSRFEDYAQDVKSRQEFVNIYKRCFSNNPNVQLINDNNQTIYSFFPVIFSSESELQSFQRKVEPFIRTRRYYFPTVLSGYKGDIELMSGSSLHVSEGIAPRTLCLPVYVYYDDSLAHNLENLIRLALKELT